LQRWREDGRQDLLDRVNHLGWIWVDPLTKRPVVPCPHIDRSDPQSVRCSIYQTRPDMCRDYPTLAHGKRCLHGVFMEMWIYVCVESLPGSAAVLEVLPLAA
jgi:Fe-S-cluster containining protein